MADHVIVVEPDNEQVTRALLRDASGQDWEGYIDTRGETTYWLLLTPSDNQADN